MSHLRDCILGKGQVFHQHIQAFVLLVQELPDPPGRETPDIRAFQGLWDSLELSEKPKTEPLQHFGEKKAFSKRFRGLERVL